MSQSSGLYSVTIHMPADLDDDRVGSLSMIPGELALSTSMMREGNDHRGPWVISWFTDNRPDAESIAAAVAETAKAVIEPVPETNWLEHSYKQFQPFTVERFFIYGSHYDGTVPEGLTGLQIDAATAFGSGEHGTTAGCLRALDFLAHTGLAPAHILDMGTGSGILAIAAAKLWPAPVLAVDIEEESVRLTGHHAALNNVTAAVKALHGDGYATPAVQTQKPFELVIANILAGPLIVMAPQARSVLAGAGYLLLSGMLQEQAAEVLAAHETQGLALIKRYDVGDWTSLLLRA